MVKKMKSIFPEIVTDGIKLRQIVENDIEFVFKGLSNPDVIKYYAVHFDTIESTEAQMNWYRGLESNQTGIWWAICSNDTSEFYGAIGFNNWEHEHRKAEIGFWILPAYWGKNIVSRAISKVLIYGIEVMNLHRVEAYIETENSPSKKLLRKYHFLHEGTMVDCELKNGEFISIDIFALIESKIISK